MNPGPYRNDAGVLLERHVRYNRTNVSKERIQEWHNAIYFKGCACVRVHVVMPYKFG